MEHYGLGFCLQCCGQLIADGADGTSMPNPAVTLAPMLHTLPSAAGPVTGMVAVPACLECLANASLPKRSLWVPGGVG